MVEVGSNLWGSSHPTPLLKQGDLEQVVQDCGQVAFEYLQGYLHNLTGLPLSVLSHPHSEIVFPDIQREPPVLQSVPVASDLVTGCLAPSSLHPSFRYPYTLMRSP